LYWPLQAFDGCLRSKKIYKKAVALISKNNIECV
jgi:hypothetical protein